MSGGTEEQDRWQARVLPTVTSDDKLPTAAVIMAAKRGAAKVCAERAADCAWPSLDAAKAWLELIPLVALAALGELCPDVIMGRLARCVGLDPLDGPDALTARRAQPLWPADAVMSVVLACGGGR